MLGFTSFSSGSDYKRTVKAKIKEIFGLNVAYEYALAATKNFDLGCKSPVGIIDLPFVVLLIHCYGEYSGQ